MLFFCQIHHEITSGQIHDSKQKDVKISTSTQLCETLSTDSQDILVHHSLLHRATTGVQMAAPVPGIMDTPSYTTLSENVIQSMYLFWQVCSE
jgi:hypothetical protein